MIRTGLFLASATAALALSAATVRADDAELTIFDWAGFGLPEFYQPYVDKYGDKPTFAFFGDDDEAFQKLTTGFKVDLTRPCSQMVGKYRDAGLIEPWDTAKIPSFTSMNPGFTASPVIKDDAGLWFLPTDYGYTAVGYNTTEVPAEDVASLEVFRNPKYAGRIALPDNTDDVWALALLATGVSDWTTVTDEQFAAAAAWLREAHANVRVYWSDPAELAALMTTGEVLVSWTWNDTIVLLKGEDFPIGFQRQAKEGASTFFCGYINMKDGPGSEDKAYDYVNAFLADVSAKPLLDNIGYATTNATALATISAEDLARAEMTPVDSIQLAQVPLDQGLRQRMLEEFELIKSGF